MKQLLLCLAFFSARSVLAGPSLWQPVTPVDEPVFVPQRYAVFGTDLAQLDGLLKTAPADPTAGISLPLPQPDGSMRLFRVWKAPVGDVEFSARFPELQAYTAVAADNANVTAKLDRTPEGFHGFILDGSRMIFIDPYNRSTDSRYLVYDRSDVPASALRAYCNLDAWVPEQAGKEKAAHKINGSLRRTYRLALSCTGEYALAVSAPSAPTKALVLGKMLTTINRVNGVYERELAVTLQLIGTTDKVIFLNPSTDPFSNNSNAGALLDENQAATDQLIGTLNYDIGHVFSTGSGGLATLGCVCRSINKAEGTTGRPDPVGDPFDIDFVAHEFGHQFGADHTFNAATGSCWDNGDEESAYEPGSGSTIMAYAGICGSGDNLQPNSDAYFHVRSLDQITTYVASGFGATCPATAPTGNTPPVVPSYQRAYSIPWLTPFELTAPVAVDASSTEQLTYCWDESDLGQFSVSFANVSFAGPIFRSFFPDTARTRVFPRPARLVRNTYSYLGEKLPSVARTVRFQLTVRDVLNGIGGFNWGNSDTVVLSVVPATDTFRVLSFNDAASPIGNDDLDQTVRWNVSNTAAAPISCASVDIYYSTDSGYTWPYLLKAATPNDGSERVTLPNVPTLAGRIKVKAVDNVFFDINDAPMNVANAPKGLPASALASGVSVFPVPASEAITIRTSLGLGLLQATVSDMAGRIIWAGAVSGQQVVPVSGWSRGLYLLKLLPQGGNPPVIRRFSVQ